MSDRDPSGLYRLSERYLERYQLSLQITPEKLNLALADRIRFYKNVLEDRKSALSRDEFALLLVDLQGSMAAAAITKTPLAPMDGRDILIRREVKSVLRTPVSGWMEIWKMAGEDPLTLAAMIPTQSSSHATTVYRSSVTGLIAGLGSDSYRTRVISERALIDLAPIGTNLVIKAARETTDLDTRTRLNKILNTKKFGQSMHPSVILADILDRMPISPSQKDAFRMQIRTMKEFAPGAIFEDIGKLGSN